MTGVSAVFGFDGEIGFPELSPVEIPHPVGNSYCLPEAVGHRNQGAVGFLHLVCNQLLGNQGGFQIHGCVILVNGAGAKKQTKLQDGDLVVLMSPVAGG